MGKGSELKFLQRRYANNQKEHKKMLNIISHQENENLIHKIPLHTHEDWLWSKRQIMRNAGEDVEWLELSYTAGGV